MQDENGMASSKLVPVCGIARNGLHAVPVFRAKKIRRQRMHTSENEREGEEKGVKDKIKIIFNTDPDSDGIEVYIKAAEKDKDVEELINRISGGVSVFITATDADGAQIKIMTDEIVYVSVSGKLVQIVTENERYTVRQSLQTIESKLEKLRFMRISRYEIVNLDKVRKYDFTLAGTLRLELVGGMETWASRRSIPAIRK